MIGRFYFCLVLNLSQLTTDPDNGKEIIDNFHKLVIDELQEYYPEIITDDDKEGLGPLCEQKGYAMPNVKLSIYKNRRGSYNKGYL